MDEILEINGPILTVRLPEVVIGEQVCAGTAGLVGEVIGRDEDRATIQMYESTDGLRPGESVRALGHPLSVELGPGLLGAIFDGVQRPLDAIQVISGDRIARGLAVASLDRQRAWRFEPLPGLEVGTAIDGGATLGTVQETASILHRIHRPAPDRPAPDRPQTAGLVTRSPRSSTLPLEVRPSRWRCLLTARLPPPVPRAWSRAGAPRRDVDPPVALGSASLPLVGAQPLRRPRMAAGSRAVQREVDRYPGRLPFGGSSVCRGGT